MTGIPETIAKAMATRIANELVKKLLPRMEDPLMTQMLQIEAKVDQDLLGWLKAGLEQLRLERREQAIDSLIHAEAREPHSPVAKLLLSATLLLTDPTNVVARDKAIAAILQNPFLNAELTQSVMDEGLLGTEAPDPAGWTIELHTDNPKEYGFEKTPAFPVRLLAGWKGSMIRQLATSLDPTTGTLAIVVRWHPDFETSDEPAKFNLPRNLITGIIAEKRSATKRRWSLVLDGSTELIVVTPRYVVVKTKKPKHEFMLFDTLTGRLHSAMSALYFEMSFWPQWKDVGTCRPYLASHRELARKPYAIPYVLGAWWWRDSDSEANPLPEISLEGIPHDRSYALQKRLLNSKGPFRILWLLSESLLRPSAAINRIIGTEEVSVTDAFGASAPRATAQNCYRFRAAGKGPDRTTCVSSLRRIG